MINNHRKPLQILQSPSSNLQNPSVEPLMLHKPCQKDLRVSYLEQYQLKVNKNLYDAEMDKSRTRDALRDITDKYGFVWDQNGKLKKKDQLKVFTRKIEKKETAEKPKEQPRNQKRSVSCNPSSKIISENSVVNLPTQNTNTSECWEKTKQYESFQNLVIEERELDQRINKIWKKYRNQPLPQSKTNTFNDLSGVTTLSKEIKDQKSSQYQYNSVAIRNNPNNIPEKTSSNHSLPANDDSTIRHNRFYKERSPRFSCAQNNIYDEKIDEITNKIKKCEEQKEKLEIQYKRFDIESVSRSKSKSKSPFTKRRYKQQFSPVGPDNHRPVPMVRNRVQDKDKDKKYSKTPNYSLDRSDREPAPKYQRQNFEKSLQAVTITEANPNNISKSFSFEADKPKEQSRHHQIQEQLPSEYPGARASVKQQQMKEQEKQQSYPKMPTQHSQQEDHQTIEQFIFEEDMRIVDSHPIPDESPQQSHKPLIQQLLRQIQLDQEFRNSRIWFYNSDDPHKWGILADTLLTNHNTKYNYHQLFERFQSSPDQRNPFFSIRDCKQNYESLIHSYMESSNHWNRKILNKFTEQNLEEAGFTLKQLDIENKSKLRVEDFVRYLNMKTKSFFRNRDFTLVFTRFAGQGKGEVQFSRLIRLLVC